MLFNSYIFILLFFPLVLAGYYLLNKLSKTTWRNVFLILMSLWFYGYYNPYYLFVICGSIGINYGISKIIGSTLKKQKKAGARAAMIIGVVINVAVIFFFKYFDFFLSNVNKIFSQDFNLLHIVLPLGISFFTFQQISYLVDSYRGETDNYSFIEYALFVCYFPQLIAGPIVLHSEMIPQFRDEAKRKFNPQSFSTGLYIFSLGLFKKVWLADTFGKAVAWGFGTVDTLSTLEALIVSLSYTFQLYFDFSGYCDMAVGIGKMMNFELVQNFNSPYKAVSIIDFWDRWHISLTRFLRTYIYFPLGGSRKGKFRTYLNIMVVFLISGIWHGANWTFILWGVIHGAANCLNRVFKSKWEKFNTIFQWGMTFGFVNLLWILFRADSIPQWIKFLGRLFSFKDFSISDSLLLCFDPGALNRIEAHFFRKIDENFPYWNYNVWIFLILAFFIVLNCKNSKEQEFKPTVVTAIVCIGCFVWAVLSFTGVSTFLYFDF